jgi:hypothetical protein
MLFMAVMVAMVVAGALLYRSEVQRLAYVGQWSAWGTILLYSHGIMFWWHSKLNVSVKVMATHRVVLGSAASGKAVPRG